MPRIAPETVEKVASSTDIVDVIGNYFPLKRAGTGFVALCPFHKEKSPSFHVSPQRQNYHCFGCGAGGSVFRFLMEYENLDFPSAVRRLADRANIPVVEEVGGAEEDGSFQIRKRLLKLHAEAAGWFHQNLLRTKAGAEARDYLKSRGFGKETAVGWKIGFAPDAWAAFTDWAVKSGYTERELLSSGLVKPRDEDHPERGFYDRFRGRIMFPICNEQGEVIAFSGRILNPDVPGGKYINSPETPLFTKGSVLFGLHRSKRPIIEAGSAVVCEGQLDLIRIFESGVENVLAPQGTAFTQKQARVIKRLAGEAILCFDSDGAGQKAAERSFAALLAENMNVRVAEMPPGEDPDSLIRHHGPEEFRAILESASDFFDYLAEHLAREIDLSSGRGRVEYAARMAAQAALVTDPILRDSVVQKVASRLAIPAPDFTALVKKQKGTYDSHASREDPEADARVRMEIPKISPGVSLLILLCLQDEASGAWLRARPDLALLQELPETDLLQKAIQSGAGEWVSGSIAAYLSSLEPGEEAAVVKIMESPLPSDANLTLVDCWNDLRKRSLVRKRSLIEDRLKSSELPPSRVLELQKEILDLQMQLSDITRLSVP